MDGIIYHIKHLLAFDGVLHWCFFIALFCGVFGARWVVIRMLLPLHQLARQAQSIMNGHLPDFSAGSHGIPEVEQLRQSLHCMVEQIRAAQEREVTYRQALTQSQENERLRIAREIHDETIQSLVLVTHHLERARTTPDNTHYLEQARSQLIGAIDDLRQVIANLRPTVLEELGLATAIEGLCESYENTDFTITGESYPIRPDQELTLFRAAQEALHNAHRHAHARHITVVLAYTPNNITLNIQDNGQGFNLPQQLQDFVARGHYGLIGIRERILHCGGQFDIFTQPTFGTRVIITLPL